MMKYLTIILFVIISYGFLNSQRMINSKGTKLLYSSNIGYGFLNNSLEIKEQFKINFGPMLSGGFYINRSLIYLRMNINCGKSRSYLSNQDFIIENNEKMDRLQTLFGYGYNVIASNICICPNIGIGYSRLNSYRRENSLWLRSFSIYGGLKMDILLLPLGEGRLYIFSNIGSFYERFNSVYNGFNYRVSLGINYKGEI